MVKNKKLAEKYLEQNGFRKAKGFAIDDLNPDNYDEVFFEGETLEKAIEGHFRILKEFWIYEPSDGEQVFEDINDAIEYAEEDAKISFEDFIKLNNR